MMPRNLTRERTGAPLRLGEEIAHGAEGRIVRIVEEPGLVAKLYRATSAEHASKLFTMIARPPVDPLGAQGYVSIAWPLDRILDEQHECVGFIMPAVDTTTTAPLFKVYNPGDRRRIAPGISWQ